MRQQTNSINTQLSATTQQRASTPVQSYCQREELFVDQQLLSYVESEVLAGDAIKAEQFWQNLLILVEELGPAHRALRAREMPATQRVLDHASIAIPEAILDAMMAATLGGQTEINEAAHSSQELAFHQRLQSRSKQLTTPQH